MIEELDDFIKDLMKKERAKNAVIDAEYLVAYEDSHGDHKSQHRAALCLSYAKHLYKSTYEKEKQND